MVHFAEPEPAMLGPKVCKENAARRGRQVTSLLSPRVPVYSSGCWSPPQPTVADGHLQEGCNLLSEKGHQDKTQAGHLGSEILPAIPNASLDLLTLVKMIRQQAKAGPQGLSFDCPSLLACFPPLPLW